MDIKALKERVKVFYKLALYGDRSAFLKRIGQSVVSVPEQTIEGQPPNPNAPPEVINVPEQIIEGTPPQAAYFLPISAETQNQLSDLLMPKGLIPVKLNPDKKIGPQTRQALNAFKQHYNLPATPANIKNTWEKERDERLAQQGVETKFPESPKTPADLESAVKYYEQLPQTPLALNNK